MPVVMVRQPLTRSHGDQMLRPRAGGVKGASPREAGPPLSCRASERHRDRGHTAAQGRAGPPSRGRNLNLTGKLKGT